MNILHVTAQRPDSTGSGVYLGETVQALAGEGHAQAVVAGVGAHDVSPFSPEVLFEPVRFQTPELPFAVVGMSDVMPYEATRYRDLTPGMVARFKASFSAAFDRVFAAFAPDVVICHHLYLVCGVLMDWLAAHPDVRSACSVRGVSHNTDLMQFGAHGLERDFIRSGVRALDWACALHDEQARRIVRAFGVDPARVRVTGTGYNAQVFAPAEHCGPHDSGAGEALADALPADAGARLVYVGKLWKQKGLLQLFEALDALPPDVAQGMRIELIGGHSDEAERDQIVHRAESCRVPVHFAGKVGQDELVEAYRRADVFVLPSFSEGLPLVAVEALACGCKVVMTDLPGVRDWFGRYVPDAPIRYVGMPSLANGDPACGIEPADESRFVSELASEIAGAVGEPAGSCDLSALSWQALAKRLIS